MFVQIQCQPTPIMFVSNNGDVDMHPEITDDAGVSLTDDAGNPLTQ